METAGLATVAALSFGAGVVAGRATTRPSPAPTPPPVAPSSDAPPTGDVTAAAVAHALALHGAQERFREGAPAIADVRHDVAAFGTRRYAEGQQDASTSCASTWRD